MKFTIMKFKLLFTVFVFFLTLNTMYASFPVKRVATTSINTEESVNVEKTYTLAITQGQSQDKWVGVALWFFLGVFAAHRWYYKKPTGWNILFILTLGGLGVWAVVDLINMLTDKW